jgi:transposase-like protein
MAGRIKIMEIRRYSEVLKRRVVEEYESGSASVRELMGQYGILCKDSIYLWCKRYGRFKKVTKVVRVIMKSEKERILELERAVADLTLKNRVLETHVRILEREVGEEVKKS